MPALFRRFAAVLAALVLSSGLAFAQSKVTLAVGGGGCLCYLPTILAKQLGEFEKAGVTVEVVDFKGGSNRSRPSSVVAPMLCRAISITA